MIRSNRRLSQESIDAARAHRKRSYKVTSTVYVKASNPRHAAHIAKGIYALEGDEAPQKFLVEETGPLNAVEVDLSKRFPSEPGYATWQRPEAV